MLRRIVTLLFGALLLALGGCEDGGGPDPDAGAPVDQCTSQADQDLLLPMGEAGPAVDALTDGASCALMVCADALFNGTAEEGQMCMDECFAASPSGALSQGCQDCYQEVVFCIGLECFAPCQAGDPACLPCIETNCIPRLQACTGLPVGF